MPTAICRLIFVAALVSFAATPLAQNEPEGGHGGLSRAERAAGWRVLFDGHSTSAWRGYKKDAFPGSGWVVEDGALRVVKGEGGGDIVTVDEFRNFELTLEWRTGPKGNSGIMYRVTETHDTPWKSGPEYQILDDAGAGVAADGLHSAGALYDLCAPAAAKTVKPAGEWNAARIVVRDDRAEHWLNGVKVVDTRLAGDEWTALVKKSKFGVFEGFGVASRGRIALQEHGDDVWFKNVRVRDLDAAMPGEIRLFNDRDLTGWACHLNDGGKLGDVWSVRDGVLICKGSPAGYLKSASDFTNYVLKLEWRFDPVTKKAGNSGVLLRQIGDDKVWPKSVEAQLQSGSAGDFWNIDGFQMTADPARTSGRNTKKTHFAERPVGEWNEYEIVVDHDTVTLIVNGEVLNRATAVAEVAGKICLQSEGAEIHFRNVRLAPIP